MSTATFRSAIDRSAILRDRCLRYVETLMVQSSQVAACNARHNLPERLARWLLIIRERIDSDDLSMTQGFLSVMLGVRRSGVSVAARTPSGRRSHSRPAGTRHDPRSRRSGGGLMRLLSHDPGEPGADSG